MRDDHVLRPRVSCSGWSACEPQTHCTVPDREGRKGKQLAQLNSPLVRKWGHSVSECLTGRVEETAFRVPCHGRNPGDAAPCPCSIFPFRGWMRADCGYRRGPRVLLHALLIHSGLHGELREEKGGLTTISIHAGHRALTSAPCSHLRGKTEPHLFTVQYRPGCPVLPALTYICMLHPPQCTQISKHFTNRLTF